MSVKSLKRPLTVEDPNVAKKLMVEGGTLVLLGVPAGTEVGIDANSWNTGEKFMGVKMIPPGVHFVYYSSVNLSERTTAPRTGFYHNFTRGELIARRWDSQNEDLVNDMCKDDIQRLKDDLKNIDKQLGVYPYESWAKWISLSNRITDATLCRLEPIQHTICSVTDLVPDPANQPDKTQDPRLPSMIARPGTGIRYSRLSGTGLRFPAGSDAAEITRHSMDSTFKLTDLMRNLETLYGDQVSGGSMSGQNLVREVLAEIQFSFLCFLIGQNYDSFEQWKQLVVLMCCCDSGLVEHSQLFIDFLSDLYFQMKEVPEDFFVDIVSSNNFLCSSLSTLFVSIKESNNVTKELKDKARKFERNVSKKFGWDFSEDLSEYAPVVVSTES